MESLKFSISSGLIVVGALTLFFPERMGPLSASLGEREIIGTILLVGGIITFFMRTYKD